MGSLARVLLDLNLLSRWLGTPATWNGFWHPLGTVAKGSAPGAESIDQLQHPTGGVMDTLTRIDVLDFDDTSSAPSDSVDSVDFVSAVTDEPRHHLLSHRVASGPRALTCFRFGAPHIAAFLVLVVAMQ